MTTMQGNVAIIKYGSVFREYLEMFNENIVQGPVYVYTYCLLTWFKCSFFHTENNNVMKNDDRNMLLKYITSKDDNG